MATKRKWQDPPRVNLGTLLLAAYRAFDRELFAAFEARGHGELKSKHGAVLANIDRDGTRPSLLAERAGLTRPSIGELVDELERLGYVRRVVDPSDRRAKLVVLTDRGFDVVVVAEAAIAGIEATWRSRLGGRRFEALRAALAEATVDDAPASQPRARQP
jgi:DNA-binding MarR family transcriptional regulator